jgi:4-hydroxybenzoate polyprenyltransferase
MTTHDGQVADAPPDNWVDRFAPRATRPFLRLSRADRPIGTWLLFIPCLWAIGAAAIFSGGADWRDLWLVIGSGIGALLMRGAGCTWNDLTDRDFDASVARTRSRPLPSGQVTPRGAAIWMIAQSLIAFLILLTFGPLAIGLGVASLALVAVYPFAKRFTWWPQVFLGLAFNWGAVLLWAASTGDLHWPALALYAGGIAWTLFYDTIYAHQDKDDDALIGVRSTARLFADRTPTWLFRFLVLTVLLLMIGVIGAVAPGGNVLALTIALCGVWAMGWHLLWQLGRLDTEDAGICLRLFRSNRDAGLILAAALAIALMI